MSLPAEPTGPLGKKKLLLSVLREEAARLHPGPREQLQSDLRGKGLPRRHDRQHPVQLHLHPSGQHLPERLLALKRISKRRKKSRSL